MVDRSVALVIRRGSFGSTTEFNLSYTRGDELLGSEGSISKESVRKHVEIFLSSRLPSGVVPEESHRRLRRE